MPLYDVECRVCGKLSEEQVKLGVQMPNCECGGERRITILTPRQFRVQGATGPFYSDAQVESTHGKRWREEGTTGREGGAGRALHFHRRAR